MGFHGVSSGFYIGFSKGFPLVLHRFHLFLRGFYIESGFIWFLVACSPAVRDFTPGLVVTPDKTKRGLWKSTSKVSQGSLQRGGLCHVDARRQCAFVWTPS